MSYIIYATYSGTVGGGMHFKSRGWKPPLNPQKKKKKRDRFVSDGWGSTWCEFSEFHLRRKKYNNPSDFKLPEQTSKNYDVNVKSSPADGSSNSNA